MNSNVSNQLFIEHRILFKFNTQNFNWQRYEDMLIVSTTKWGFFLFKSLKHANFGFGYYLFNTVKELFIKPKSFIVCSVSKDMDHENSYIYFKQSTRSKKKKKHFHHISKVISHTIEKYLTLYIPLVWFRE